MKFNFTKLTGAGNDFILFDGINESLPELTSELIQSLCARRLGIGADGILIILPSDKFDYRLKYFNADGSSGMLCANGARASLVYVHEKIEPERSEFEFECCNKKYSGKVVSGSEAIINLPDINEGEEHTLLVEGNKLNVYVADTGAPQAVIDFSDIGLSGNSFDEFDFIPFAQKIRHHEKFLPDGVNVNIIAKVNGEFRIRSFERGIEDETLACGTGITAAAMFLSEKKGEKTPIEIISRSKKKFIINFRKKLANFEGVSLRGHAAIVYNGNLDLEENK